MRAVDWTCLYSTEECSIWSRLNQFRHILGKFRFSSITISYINGDNIEHMLSCNFINKEAKDNSVPCESIVAYDSEINSISKQVNERRDKLFDSNCLPFSLLTMSLNTIEENNEPRCPMLIGLQYHNNNYFLGLLITKHSPTSN